MCYGTEKSVAKKRKEVCFDCLAMLFRVTVINKIIEEKSMKRLFSMILTLTVFLLSMIPMCQYSSAISTRNSSITYTNEELDLSQYTLDDLFEMSSYEYRNLVREFERVYDPFGSYDPTEAAQDDLEASNGDAELQWTSGKIVDGEYTDDGTHEYITTVACEILSNDRGAIGSSVVEGVAVVLSISLASLLPDKDEWFPGFNGHFFDPNTGKNYTGSSSNTAKTNAQEHYDAAVTAANSGDMNEAYEQIGRCLHYIQDASEPHHASNVVSYGSLSPHAKFEKYAYGKREVCLMDYTTIGSSYYTTAINSTVSSMVIGAATIAKAKIGMVNDTSDQSQWYSVCTSSLKCAARYSAMVLYKFSRLSSVPFVSN